MGMVGNFRTISDSSIDALRRRPMLLEPLLFDDEELLEGARLGFFGRRTFARLRAEPAEEIDIDKSWGMLHFVLTGTETTGPWPQNFMFSGEEIFDKSKDDGIVAMAHRRARLKEIRDVLAKVTPSLIEERWGADRMKELDIYLARALEQAEAQDYVHEYAEILLGFVDKAIEQRRGMLLYIA